MKKLMGLLLTVLLVGCSSANKAILLDAEFYAPGGLIPVETYKPLQDKIDEKGSFAVYVYSAGCLGCTLFSPIIEKVLGDNNLRFYRIDIADYKKESNLAKATPSVVVYQEGDFYTLMDPSSKKDEAYFNSENGFTKWINKYIAFPDVYVN